MSYTKQTEDQLAREIIDQFLFSKRYLDPIHEKMNKQEELYRTYLDPNNYPHTARVFDPRIFRIIETITPRMVANEPSGSFYPVEEGDQVTVEILNTLIKYDWRRADMFPKLVTFVKSMLIFGTAFGRTFWDYRESERTRMVPKEVNGRMMWTPKNNEKIKVTQFDGPNFEPLNIYDCFFDPNSTTLENMRWFIYRSFKTIKELKATNDTRGEAYYKNLDKLEELINQNKEDKKATTSANPSYMQFREHRRVMLSTQELVGQDASNPEVVVLRRFTTDGWCDIVPEYNLVIREVENPYFDGEMPIVYGVDYPYPGELLGMGEIEPVDRIQRAINAVLNQRLDNVQLIIRNMWKVRRGANVDLGALVSAPGNVIQMDDLNGLEPIIIPDATGATFVQTMDYLTSAMQNGSGITDYTQGTGDGGNMVNSTATGIRLVQQEANAQFKLKIQLFTHMVITGIANKFKNLRIQYTTEAQKLRIVGKEMVDDMMKNTSLGKIDVMGNPRYPGDGVTPKLQVAEGGKFAFLQLLPDDIQPAIVGDYDFIATVSSETLMDPIAMQQNFFIGLDRVSTPEWTQGLAQQGKMLDYAGITKKTFEKMNIGIEGEEILTELKQPQQVQPGQEGQLPQDQPIPEDMQNQMLGPQPNMFEEMMAQEGGQNE